MYLAQCTRGESLVLRTSLCLWATRLADFRLVPLYATDGPRREWRYQFSVDNQQLAIGSKSAGFGCGPRALPGQSARVYHAAVICWMAAVCSLSPAACFGQHTVVQDAGGGRKVELVYNASDQVAETRIVAQAGRLQERVEYEYRSGFLVPQQTTTSYWSDGRAVRSVTRVGYDENGNFTGEWIALSSPAGGQTGGTQLTHDPFTGIYRCSHWDPVGQDYQPGECPASEESAAAPEKAKELTYDEAMKLLELARQARREEQKAQRMERKSSVQPPIRTVMKMKQIGVILPAHLRAGERVSGSLVEDPKKYDGRPDLRLVRMDLPLESQGDATSLRGWTFEVAGEDPQRADGPVTFTVPQASELSVTLRQAGNPAHAVSRLVSAAPAAEQRPPQKPPTSPAFEAPALCLKGGLCVVRGPFNGDSSKTLLPSAGGRRPSSPKQKIPFISAFPAEYQRA